MCVFLLCIFYKFDNVGRTSSITNIPVLLPLFHYNLHVFFFWRFSATMLVFTFESSKGSSRTANNFLKNYY